ncbi:hypothetical protein HK096_004450 [Nowakowskiella sp. JEL0078]|nr:hypothetical protein HK096_004450 [Nowakowskiella sp. JEL0078]
MQPVNSLALLHLKADTYAYPLPHLDFNSALVSARPTQNHGDLSLFHDMFANDSYSSIPSSICSASIPSSPSISALYPEPLATDNSAEPLMNLELPPEQSEMCENLIQQWEDMDLGKTHLDTSNVDFHQTSSHFTQTPQLEIVPDIVDASHSYEQIFRESGHGVRVHSRSRSMSSFELHHDIATWQLTMPHSTPSFLMSPYIPSPLNPLSSVSAIDSAHSVQSNSPINQVNSITIPPTTSLATIQPNSVSIEDSISNPTKFPSTSLPAKTNSLTILPEVRKRTLSQNQETFENMLISVPENISVPANSTSKRTLPSNNIQSSKGVLLLPLPALHKKKESLSGPELFAKLDEELRNVDFEDVTVNELKDMLRQRSLPSTGKKAILVERLKKELELANARKEDKKPDDDLRLKMYQTKTVTQNPDMLSSLSDGGSPPPAIYPAVSPQIQQKLLPGKRGVMKHTHSRNKSFSDTRMLARMWNNDGGKRSTFDVQSLSKSNLGVVDSNMMQLDEDLNVHGM